MAYEQIQVDIKSGVATITLNRPEKLNAYTAQMGSELHRAFAELDENDDARVIVVTGAGRAFCAGADLSARGGATFDRARSTECGGRASRNSAVEYEEADHCGHQWAGGVGVGITLPMQWDIRVAAESARIGFVFVRRGVLPEALSTWLLPRLIGIAKTNELLMSGRIINAKEALEFGIVSHVWPDAEFKQRVNELASDIADNTAPVSVAMTKRLIYGLLGELSPEKAQAIDHKAFTWAGQQADSKEGVSSFLEKRKPAWKLKASKDFPDFLPPVK